MADYGLTFRKARLMDKDLEAAAAIRCRYLYDDMELCLKDGSEIAGFWYLEAVEEALYLLENAAWLNKKSPSEEKVLDIEGAKAYPITELIQFDRNGKAKAWCHNDKRPSLTYNPRNNTAKCWPCNEQYDTIAVLMSRDSMSFLEAVKFLTR